MRSAVVRSYCLPSRGRCLKRLTGYALADRTPVFDLCTRLTDRPEDPSRISLVRC